MVVNIAIDGPAGAGKSTIAKMVARKLDILYVDTGAMYRAMGLMVKRQGIDPKNGELVAQCCAAVSIELKYENQEQVVYINGENVNPYIRTQEIGNMASTISAYLPVRRKLVAEQQKIAKTTSLIMDGRDIGTCVLPEAPVKIYLTASAEVRADRRYKELCEKQEACDYETILKEIKERDHRDMTRDISPLKQAEDAVLVDTSSLNIQESVEAILKVIKEKMGE